MCSHPAQNERRIGRKIAAGTTRLSTMTVCLRLADSLSASARVKRSCGTPAGRSMMILTGRWGYDCADAWLRQKDRSGRVVMPKQGTSRDHDASVIRMTVRTMVATCPFP